MKNFFTEKDVFDLLQKINIVKTGKREAAHKRGSKCIGCVLKKEETLRNVAGIEIIEFSEITESDNRGCLTRRVC